MKCLNEECHYNYPSHFGIEGNCDKEGGIEKCDYAQTKCICCGKNEVTWPRVCSECRDESAQAQLALDYGYD